MLTNVLSKRSENIALKHKTISKVMCNDFFFFFFTSKKEKTFNLIENVRYIEVPDYYILWIRLMRTEVKTIL